MKFVKTTDYRYWWPVKVAYPHPDPDKAGQVLEFAFKVQFRAMPTSEAQAIRQEVEALAGDAREARQSELLKRAIVGWDEDVVDENNQPIPFSEAVLEELLADVWVLMGLLRAWTDSMVNDKARKGN